MLKSTGDHSKSVNIAHAEEGLPAQSERATLPRSLYQGEVPMGEAKIEAHHLSNGLRVFVPSSMIVALSGGVAKHRDFERIIARLPNGNRLLEVSTKVKFLANGGTIHGYPCEWFADVLEEYDEAAYQGLLRADQKHYADNARKLRKGLTRTGIIALVDDHTGYTKHRDQHELSQKLALYLLDERSDWQNTFPSQFFECLHKLYQIPLNGSKHPQFFGKFITDFVYRAIDEDVAIELKSINPNPKFGSNHHQHLSPYAREILRIHLIRLMAVMRQSSNSEDFKMRFNAEFNNGFLQLALVN